MNARRHPSDIQDTRLLAVLDKYVPPIIARSIVERARREAISGPEVSWTDPNGLLDRISVGVRLFAAPEHVAAILRGITDLAADDQEEGPDSAVEDSGPASTLKPASVRARLEEPRVRHEEQPPTRREIPPAPPSASNAVPPPSRRDSPSSRNSPASRDLSAREPLSSRDVPHTRETPAVRRDTDVASFASSRTPAEPGPGHRGVFPSTHRESSPRAAPPPPAARALDARAPGPLTARSSSATAGAARGPSIEGIPAIPPPPPPANLREPRAAARATPPAAGAPPERTSTSTTQQSLQRLAATAAASHDRAQPLASRTSTDPAARVPFPHRSVLAPGIIDPRSSGHGHAPPAEPPREITLSLETEHDIPRARQVAREICEALGTRALTQQRLVTIVSELGRNMVLYAGGGKITLRPPSGGSRRVVVLAVDQGPGISNLSEIMAGRYKSRSGLGLGIVGTKRLADAFHIDTGRHGTAVSVEVIV